MSDWLRKLKKLETEKPAHVMQESQQSITAENSTPKNERQQINIAMGTIRKAGGVIKPDGSGLTFNYLKKPETVQDVQAAFKLVQDAWAAYLDIRQLIIKKIDVHSIGGKMIKARLFNGIISIIGMDELDEADKERADEVLKEYPVCMADFESVEISAKE